MEECCEHGKKNHDNKIGRKPGKANLMFIFFVAFLIVASGVTVYLLLNKSKEQTSSTGQTVKLTAGEKQITVYKSESCGCCDGYITHLKRSGFDVNVVSLEDVAPIKQKYNMPANMQSCHTAVIGDYVVEGHVPAQAITKLLAQKPAIVGIALPGMQSASPGMPGTKQGPFKIYALHKDGTQDIFMTL